MLLGGRVTVAVAIFWSCHWISLYCLCITMHFGQVQPLLTVLNSPLHCSHDY